MGLVNEIGFPSRWLALLGKPLGVAKVFPPSNGFLVQVSCSQGSDSEISKIVAPWTG